MPTISTILQLRVKLVGSKPPIWRKIAVPNMYSFFDLHVALQDAMGWHGAHLHQFFTAEPYKRNSQYQCIAFPIPEMEDVVDERKVKLNQFFKQPKDTLWYEYDFGDGWMHEVKLEKVVPKETNKTYPLLIGVKRACPFEDSGGLWGYYDMLEVLKNPKDKEHKDVLEWLGIKSAKEFDPEEFDEEKVTFQDPRKHLREYERNILSPF